MEFLEQISKFNQISESQIPQMQDDFETAIIHPTEVVSIFKALHSYFSQINFDSQFIVDNYTTYWRWYIESAWKNILNLKQDEFFIVFSKQFVPAFVLDYPVDVRLLDFMYYKIGDVIEVQKFYKELRSSIFEDRTPITTVDYTTARLVEDIRSLDRKKDIERADILSQIESEIFSSARSFFEFTSAEKSERMENILYFINFLLEHEDISEIYEDYLVSFIDYHDDDIPKEEKMTIKREPQILSTSEEVLKLKAFSYQEIFEKIKNEILSSPTDERDDRILTRLDELSNKYNDEKIRDLYYYDEQSGKFVWNEELLNSSEQESQ